jgi:hypothetical protein
MLKNISFGKLKIKKNEMLKNVLIKLKKIKL